MNIVLNEDQTELIKLLMSFLANDEQYFLLAGQAGVGKTMCMKMFKDAVLKRKPGTKICMCAPTNKATSVLRNSIDDKSIDFRTIYSVLGLRMEPNGGIKELKDKGNNTIESYDIVILDEGSMVSEELLEYIQSKTVVAGVKMIIIGDREQLNPVKEESSPIWRHFDVDFELTKVMRHQNSILQFVQSIRGNPNPVFVSTGPEVFIEDDVQFMDGIEKSAKAGLFHSGKAKAIAWRNVTVDFLNRLIREAHTSGIEADFVIGDRVVFKEPVYIQAGPNKVPLAHTDAEGVVTGVIVTQHNKYSMLKSWKLSIRLDDGTNLVSYVIHAAAQSLLQSMLDKYASEKKWYPFWQLKEAFHSISHAYAITTHRSQGSTIPLVYIEAGDILLNKDIDERTKCLYVACSRASEELHIFA